MQLKDLTVEEFRELFQEIIRETVTDVLQEVLTESEVNGAIKPEFKASLIRQREQRLSGQSKTLSTAEMMQHLGLEG